MKKESALISLSITIFIITGCFFKANAVGSKASLSIKKTKIAETKFRIKNIRAMGKSNYGELLIASKYQEKIGKLSEDSSFGKANDYTFESDYEVIYKNNNGNIKVVTTLKDLKIIQPKEQIMAVNKLKFDGFDVFYFSPQYTGARSSDTYFFAISKEHKSFQFKFEFNKADKNEYANILTNGTTLLPQTMREFVLPEVKDGKLITITSLDANHNMDFRIFKVIYKPDFKNKVMKFISRERIN